MFSTRISARSSLVTMAVIAGLLAVAGPASAARGDLPSPSSTVEAAMLLHGDFSTFISQALFKTPATVELRYVGEHGARIAPP